MKRLSKRTLSASSKRWINRQRKDPFVKQAARDGYRSRAAYKLLDLDKKYHLLKKSTCVVDLGAAPGGWSQVAIDVINQQTSASPTVIGIDLLEITPLHGAHFIQADFTSNAAQQMLQDILQGTQPDLILSDMAPATTGHKSTDHLRLMHLADQALAFALHTLKPQGSFVVKLFQGSETPAFLQTLRTHFHNVTMTKPQASRKESTEIYGVAQQLKCITNK